MNRCYFSLHTALALLAVLSLSACVSTNANGPTSLSGEITSPQEHEGVNIQLRAVYEPRNVGPEHDMTTYGRLKITLSPTFSPLGVRKIVKLIAVSDDGDLMHGDVKLAHGEGHVGTLTVVYDVTWNARLKAGTRMDLVVSLQSETGLRNEPVVVSLAQ